MRQQMNPCWYFNAVVNGRERRRLDADLEISNVDALRGTTGGKQQCDQVKELTGSVSRLDNDC